jgi:hypothetical protein
MDRSALELYLYMNSSKEIIEWLEKEGCKTVKEAKDKLEPLVGSNMRGWAMSVGAGERGATLAGTHHCVVRVIEYFQTKEKKDLKDKEILVEKELEKGRVYPIEITLEHFLTILIKIKDKADVLRVSNLLERVGIKVFRSDVTRQMFVNNQPVTNALMKRIDAEGWGIIPGPYDPRITAVTVEELEILIEEYLGKNVTS